MPTRYVARMGRRMRSTQGRHASQPCLAEGETVAVDGGSDLIFKQQDRHCGPTGRANARSTNSVVIRGLDPRIHLLKRISRSGWIADAVQVNPVVVPANAGDHNPGSRLWQKVSHGSASSMGRGVWVPAFAGTTNECGAPCSFAHCRHTPRKR